jgi:sigma-B regulation protein RsbU (phosphoserine phosphatase)
MSLNDPGQLPGERLELLYHLSQTFNASLDLAEVLNRVMDEVIAALKAERGFLMLVDPDGELHFRTARGLDQQSIDQPEFQISRGVVEQVARDGKPVLTSDAQLDSRFSARQSVVSLGLRSILCAPLIHQEQIAGVIYVDNRLMSGIFTEADLDLLAAIASNAAIAIENARLYEIAVEKGRMERELQMARQVQASLLPAETPQIAGWEFATLWQPAREVAGDYYDFISGLQDGIGLVIGDVTDKGMPASLFMVFARSAVRSSLDGTDRPAEAITRANRLICSDSTQGLFVTLMFCYLNPADGQVTYVNAGHNPALLLRAAGGELQHLERTGIPLGIDPDEGYGQECVTLAPGDTLLLYTDGVTEAMNPQGEEFGQGELEALVKAAGGGSAAELVASLKSALARFSGPTAPSDDITMLAVRRL